MEEALLSRIQFAVAIGFHYLFPPTTFGLTFVILVLETLYLKTAGEIYKTLSAFLVKILGLVFAMGVVNFDGESNKRI